MLKNGLYNALGGISKIVLSLISVPILIRTIGIEEYGIWTLASTVIGIATLVEGGISVSTTFFLSRDIGSNDEKGILETLTITLTAMLVMATLAASFFFFGAESFLSNFHNINGENYSTIVEATKAGSLVLWARLIQLYCTGLIQAYEKYKVINLLSTTQSIASNVGLIIVASLGGRTVEMMLSQIFVNLILLIANFIVSKNAVKLTCFYFTWNKEKAIEIIKYSSVAWTGALGSALFTQGDRIIVGSILNIKSLGIYAAITNVVSQINILSSLPISPLLPAITRSSHQKTRKNNLQTLKCVKQSIEVNALIAFGLGGLIILLPDRIIKLIGEGNFPADSMYLLQVAAIVYSIYSLNAVGYYILYAVKKIKLCTAIQLFSGALSIYMIWILSAKFGLIGAIFGNIGFVATVIMSVLGLVALRIKISLLARSLCFYVLWFFIASVIGLQFGSLTELTRLIIYMFGLFILISWFVKSNLIKENAKVV